MRNRNIVQELRNMVDNYPERPCPRCTMRDAADLIERLRADFDPPICRLQFPDGSVPGNLLEAAEGWKRRYEECAGPSVREAPDG